METKSKQTWSYPLLCLLFVLSNIFAAYFTQQSHFTSLFIAYTSCFACFILLYKNARSSSDVYTLIYLALGIRVLLLFALPNWSNDYFRFYWDGCLTHQGISPYTFKPAELLTNSNLSCLDVFPLLNSQSYYSVYPSACQHLFKWSYAISDGSVQSFVFINKLFFICFEIGTAFFLLQLLRKLSAPIKLSLLYIFNPFVILELYHNLHYELLVVFFISLSIWLLQYQKHLFAGISMGLAVISKLTPLLLLPIYMRYIKDIKANALFLLGMSIMILELVFYMYPYQTHFLESVNLYFKDFEFNASLYTIARSITYAKGLFDSKPIISLVFGSIVSLTALYMMLKNKKQWTAFDFAQYVLVLYIIYLFTSSTVHPWYIAIPLFFSIFNKQYTTAILLWSYLAVLSYIKYDTELSGYYYALCIVEYVCVIIALLAGVRSRG